MKALSISAAPAAVCAVSLVLAASAAGHDDPPSQRFHTDRPSAVDLPLPGEEEAFTFVVFGDRTGGPAEGIAVLADAVREANLLDPDLVMTVGDLVEGYNETPTWLEQMREFRGVMDELVCPWFPVAGNHDVYWRGPGRKPPEEHEANYEEHFGPLWYAFRHKRSWFVVLYSDEGDPQTGLRDFNTPSAQRMSAEQFEWLGTTLERAQSAEHVFVFVHHPRWLGGHYGDDWERVHRLLADAGNVTAVFGGHIHRMRYDGERDGIEYFTLATVGGVQQGHAPRAGWLHQYHVVTVRPDRIALAAFPVGSAMDPRLVTGAVGDAARTLAQLAPVVLERPVLGRELGVEGALRLALANPVERPIEVTLELASGDSRWRFAPDHAHVVLEPGETFELTFGVRRPDGLLDADYRAPGLLLQTDYLAPDWRVEVPERRLPIPLDVRALPAPIRPAVEHVLQLDGESAVARVPSASLDLPDGPFTLEGWLAADAFRDRQGFVTKTEGSEFGIFVNAGRPQFLVHLNGSYVTVEAPDVSGESGTRLVAGRWHHVAGVFDQSELRLYVDGQLVGATPATGARTPNDLPLLVGADVARDGTATALFPGRIDEVRLSVGARYTGASFEPARRFEPDADTRLLLHVDGRTGAWIHDASAGRAHAELVGAAAVADEAP